MKKYPKYKDSDIEWIGEIPEHWDIFKLKRYFSVSSGDFHSSEYSSDYKYPIYGGNGLRGYSLKYNTDVSFGYHILFKNRCQVSAKAFLKQASCLVETVLHTLEACSIRVYKANRITYSQ